MGGNIAGIYGAQIFRSDDRPLYNRGFAVNIAILVVGLLIATGRYVDDIIRRKKGTLPPALVKREKEDLVTIAERRASFSDAQPAQILYADGGTVLSNAQAK